jgi:hypothetical protein
MPRKFLRARYILPLLLLVVLAVFATRTQSEVVYSTGSPVASITVAKATPLRQATSTATTPVVQEFVVTHLSTPEPVRAAYMTSCIASGKKLRAPLLKLVDETELNALVIDIKDFSGMVSIALNDPRFVLNVRGCTIPDIKEFIGELHAKNIYVIGRVTVMQDSVFTKSHPDAAVKKKSDGTTWRDKKGLAFVDPGATEYWQYMVDLGKASHALGFDEINFDYIRYPSDGDMANAKFTRTGSTTKAAMMKKFYAYIGEGMRAAQIPTSADLFGMTTTNTDDLGIGQVLESALLAFDYVAPMVYPSHYPPNFNGWKNPNNVPYEIVHFAMSHAVTRANALEEKESGWVAPLVSTTTAQGTTTQGKALQGTTTPAVFVPKGVYAKKLRPWIQDFDYGKVYTETDVRAQMKAVYDAHLTSWMMWDPSNKYTISAYDRVASTSARL